MKEFVLQLTLLSVAIYCGGCRPRVDSSRMLNDSTATVTYVSFVQSWTKEQCQSCHSSSGQKPDLTNYQSVSKNADLILSRINGSVTPPMPPSGVPSSGIVSKFQAWIDGGKLEDNSSSQSSISNDPSSSQITSRSQSQLSDRQSSDRPIRSDSVGSDRPIRSDLVGSDSSEEPSIVISRNGDLQVTYDSFIRGYLAQRCIRCHDAGGQFPNLTRAEIVRQNAQAILDSISGMGRVSMPPNSISASPEIVARFQHWINENLP